VGHARTFFAAWQRACDAGGALVMRMEDLDPERSLAEYAQAALEDLRWLGIRWHEGPDIGGPFAPYAQSLRHAFYLAAWRRLLRGGFIYPCRCSRRDLAAALSAPHESAHRKPDPLDDEPIYPGTCRPLQGTGPQMVRTAGLELDNPSGTNCGDFVVWRRDGVPSYQLACVADDEAMRITEVVRGADLLKSTARQILLNRALGFDSPAWFHCRLVADDKGHRLAKRHDALSLRILRQRGMTPMNILSGELPVEG
jgi:glutamyl-tRNA synthetase